MEELTSTAPASSSIGEAAVTALTVAVPNTEAASAASYESLEEFTTSAVQVDLYQYQILNRLDILTYSVLIVVALLFFLLFSRLIVTNKGK